MKVSVDQYCINVTDQASSAGKRWARSPSQGQNWSLALLEPPENLLTRKTERKMSQHFHESKLNPTDCGYKSQRAISQPGPSPVQVEKEGQRLSSAGWDPSAAFR